MAEADSQESKKFNGPKKLKIYAVFTQLDWQSKIVQTRKEGYIDAFPRYSEVMMRALNKGDLSSIPKLTPSETFQLSSSIAGIASRELEYADVIETEPLFNVVKFVFYRRGRKIEQWEYAK